MGIDIKGLADENLRKGSTRLLIIVVLTAIVALAVQYQSMSSNNVKYDRALYDKCQTRLEECNEQRIIEAQDYINRIEKYSEIINKVRDEINDKTRQVEKLTTK